MKKKNHTIRITVALIKIGNNNNIFSNKFFNYVPINIVGVSQDKY